MGRYLRRPQIQCPILYNVLRSSPQTVGFYLNCSRTRPARTMLFHCSKFIQLKGLHSEIMFFLFWGIKVSILNDGDISGIRLLMSLFEKNKIENLATLVGFLIFPTHEVQMSGSHRSHPSL